MPPVFIFSSYEDRRDELLNALVAEGKITGFWSETLFPTIKDIARYGADKVKNSSIVKDYTSAAVDAAAIALGGLIPEFLPAILAARSGAKKLLHSGVNSTIDRVKEWAIKG